MKVVEPLRSIKDVNKLKDYFLDRKEYRNYLLVTICLNSALRISDVLSLKWSDIYDLDKGKFKEHLKLNEMKTDKQQSVYINKSIKEAVKLYIKNIGIKGIYIFTGREDKPITRIQAHRILKRACKDTDIPDIGCHSLRKTFGYQAWKKGVSLAVLMSIYNHSNFNVTRRYLGICQEDKDCVYKEMIL